MAPLSMSVFPQYFDYERRMISDIVRLGEKIPNVWMSFQLDITAIAEKQIPTPNPGLPSCFFMAFARVLHEQPGYVGHVYGNRIDIPKNISIRLSSRNIKGRTTQRMLTNAHELSANEVQSIMKKLLLQRDESLSPAQQKFFLLPWWFRKLCYRYWMRNVTVKGEIMGHCYFACNGKSNLKGPFTSHNSGPAGIGVYFSSVYERDGRHWVSLSVTADHRVLDAYHLTQFAEAIEKHLNNMADEGF